MKARLVILTITLLAAPAAAQEHVGKSPETGLPWHVSAPGGASWSLTCRFEPIRYEASVYNRNAWTNRMDRQGQGSQAGRLPGDDGRCTLTKTGGDGPVAIALVKNGQPTAAATNDPAQPAAINVF